jgi:NAD(P)-dependent dehydrogenase (short-subunit alcohol dehydrogenase family)
MTMSAKTEVRFTLASLFDLQGKTALVTGGSSGLGLIMAETLLRNGVRVVIASRSHEKCEQALSQLAGLGWCRAVSADVNNHEHRLLIKAALAEHFGDAGLSILVNNAGANWGARIEDYPDDAFDKVMRTNVNAVFALTRDLLPELEKAGREHDPARVINIGSMDGLHVPVVQRIPTFAYSASKAALHHLTRTLAVDLAARNITVNAVAPGFFHSRMADYVISQYGDDIAADCPMGRIGEPEEIAGVLIYLSSRAGAYTNGVILPVDGGTHVSKGRRAWMDE